MQQFERVKYLIEYLLSENNLTAQIPQDETEQIRLFRALVNVRMPKPISNEFLRVQDEYLQAEIKGKGITDITDLSPVLTDIYLWQGDIITLKCDGIVNAANAKLLGCFCPNHGCIDNAIHTYSGVQLRNDCDEVMRAQGYDEPAGQAKITKAYNLPSKYILHTVGPIVCGKLTSTHEKQLAACYRSCLTLADKHNLQSIAFCCISTGEFMFPNERAAEIAVQTVSEYKTQTQSKIKVIFNVFKRCDYDIYARLLKANR